MLALLARFYIWTKMENDVEAYVKTCLVCQQDKTERKKQAGLLQSLSISEKPWVSVSMDFISGFPKVDGISFIMVVVDRFSKYAIFIAAPSACPSDVAVELFYRHVVKFFGLPNDIVHPTFHVSFLKKYHADDMDPSRSCAKRAPPVVRKQFSEDVAEILNHRTFGMSKKNRRTEFLVLWKGKPKSEATWERDVTLWQFEKQIQAYLQKQSTRASTSSGGGVGMCARHAKQRVDLWQRASVIQAQVEREVDLTVTNRCEERTRGIRAFCQVWLAEFLAITMSEVFDGYERQYCEISATLSRKCTSALQLDGEIKKQKASEIKSGIDDAENLIRKMDLEARSLQPSIKAGLLAKLREYKSDLNNLKSELKRITNPNPNQAAREELLESGMADTLAASADQRGRLLVSTERLNHSTDRVKESRRTMLETEELGVSILQDLHQQRQSLLHAHGTLHGVDDNIGKSRKILTSMSRRMDRNKWIIGGIIAALVFAILIILYFKLVH
ncbi:hypothetical protein ZIOFF_031512 [Zingiber officinale]|uniref:Chromo domain-containing protein n=2 Tax=Zingiber officinale TaxID=94328 RepID=A0A8J5L0C7_ZINOF|nr:hypothetical protein ZIOFF_031512 [Zingiber officinale]